MQGYAFGKLVSSKVWNADGTLHSVSDGNSHATTLSNWKRGLPQLVTYADSHTESAVVNDAGWITSVTDENGYITAYDYDPMGRLSQITYPAGDSINWNDTPSASRRSTAPNSGFLQATGSRPSRPAMARR